MFTTLVSLTSCLLWIYPYAWSLDSVPICNVSQNLIDKHIMVEDGQINAIPYEKIVAKFNISQRTRNFNSIKRPRHTFLTTASESLTLADLRKAYCEKVEQLSSKQKNSNRNFFVYEINVKELRFTPVVAIDLQITRNDDKTYSIMSCKHSDSGTFNLGARLVWDKKEIQVLWYEINHIDNLQLRDPVQCMHYKQRVPAGTCPI